MKFPLMLLGGKGTPAGPVGSDATTTTFGHQMAVDCAARTSRLFLFLFNTFTFVLVFHKSLTYSNNQVSTGIPDGVESSNGGAGRLPTIAGITNPLVKMTTDVESPSSAALTAATILTSTVGETTNLLNRRRRSRGTPSRTSP